MKTAEPSLGPHVGIACIGVADPLDLHDIRINIDRNCMQDRPAILGKAYHLYNRDGPLMLQSPSIFSCLEPLRPAVKTGARLAKKALMPSSMSGPVKTRWLSARVRLIASCVVWFRESRTPARMRLRARAGRPQGRSTQGKLNHSCQFHFKCREPKKRIKSAFTRERSRCFGISQPACGAKGDACPAGSTYAEETRR